MGFKTFVKNAFRLFCGTKAVVIKADKIITNNHRVDDGWPIVSCEGRHPKRYWRDAIVVGIMDDGSYILTRLQKNAEPFYRTPDRVSLARSRFRPRISRRRRVIQSAPSPARNPAA